MIIDNHCPAPVKVKHMLISERIKCGGKKKMYLSNNEITDNLCLFSVFSFSRTPIKCILNLYI